MKDTVTIAREAEEKRRQARGQLRGGRLVFAYVLVALSAFVSYLIFASAKASASEPVYEALPEYDSNGRQLSFASTNDPRFWQGDYVCLKHNPNGAPDLDIEPILEYMAWSWSQRTDLRIDYQGETALNEIDGCIVVQWMTHIEMWTERNNMLVNGFTHSRYYASTNAMVSAKLVLRSDEWKGGFYESAKAAHTAIHELGHSIGINEHSEHEHAVMNATRKNGNYALTVDDVLLTAYEPDLCHAELTPHGDVYIPAIIGAGVTLKPAGGILTHHHEHHTGETCSGELNESGALIYDVRAIDGSFSNVRLMPVNGGYEIVGYQGVE